MYVHHRYGYAVKCHVQALDLLQTNPRFTNDHPLVVKTFESLNAAHHMHTSYRNSANIVHMGIKCEDTGEWARALKLYSIAYRIRRDHLPAGHPSLVVLLNMLGSIQIKRGELEEAMQIFELAAVASGNSQKLPNASTDPEPPLADDATPVPPRPRPPGKGSFRALTAAVTFREMGTIYELWGDADKALAMYHESLSSIATYKGLAHYPPHRGDSSSTNSGSNSSNSSSNSDEDRSHRENTSTEEEQAILQDLEMVRVARSYVKTTEVMNADKNAGQEDAGGLELLIGLQQKKRKGASIVCTSSDYDVFFPPALEDAIRNASRKGKKPGPDGGTRTDTANLEAALTLHRIAQLHRARGEYNLALAAFKYVSNGHCDMPRHSSVDSPLYSLSLTVFHYAE